MATKQANRLRGIELQAERVVRAYKSLREAPKSAHFNDDEFPVGHFADLIAELKQLDGWLQPAETSDEPAPSDGIKVEPERPQPFFSFQRESDDDPAGKYIMLRASSERFSTDPSIGDYIFAVAAIGEAMEVCEAHSDVVMGLAGALKVIGSGLADALGSVDYDDQKKIAAALAGKS